MMEKRPQMENTMRTQRECTMAPMKSRRQKTANSARKNLCQSNFVGFFLSVSADD